MTELLQHLFMKRN